MNELQVITTPVFNENTYDVYSDGTRIFMTRQQVGKALGYNEAQKAIDKIHARHKSRLDPLSVTTKLVGTDGKAYFTTVYNQRGIMEICRWSRSPIADRFMDWVWDVIEAYRDGRLSYAPSVIAGQIQEAIDNGIQKAVKEIMSAKNNDEYNLALFTYRRRNLTLEEKKEIIKLRNVKRLKVKEIAQRFGCSTSTVYNVLYDANYIIHQWRLQQENAKDIKIECQ